MPETVYPQLNTLVSVQSAKLLTAQQLDQLLLQPSPTDLGLRLEQIGFFSQSRLPAASQPAGQCLAQALDQEWSGWLHWLQTITATADPRLLRLLTWPERTYDLRVLLKSHILQKDLHQLYSPLSLLPEEILLTAGTAATPPAGLGPECPDAPELCRWQAACQTALADFKRHHSFSRVQLILNCLQDQEMNQLAGQLEDTRIQTYTRTWLDLEWLAVLLQLRQEKGDSHRDWLQIRRSPVAGLRADISRLFQLDRKAQDQYLARTAYARLWQRAVGGAALQPVAFEIGRRQQLQQLRDAARWEPFGLFPLLALLGAKQQEINLLRQINAGLSAGLSPGALRSRLFPEDNPDGGQTWASKVVPHA
ncbi:MAG: V-type ATPase subunit [Oscillospiraceae bacterium]|nr:V-type ATPase subunit [Oscillospiraceae bacterium]MDD4368959.1 V-type ATPase subunit [Oscillospiraceae bacterium]